MERSSGQAELTIAAFSDTHFDHATHVDEYKEHITDMSRKADIIAHCGDFTDFGSIKGARRFADICSESTVPIIGVLGNHDFSASRRDVIATTLTEAGIQLLKGDTFDFYHEGRLVSFIGTSGFNGRYPWEYHGRVPMDKPEYHMMKTKELEKFAANMENLEGNNNIVLLHFQPVKRPKVLPDGTIEEPARNNEYGDLIQQNSNRIQLVLHGHDHTDGDPERKIQGVETINIAMPIVIEMTPGVPYRLIPVPLEPAYQY